MEMDGDQETTYRRPAKSEEEISRDIRKGPWTDEEDSLLINYINFHGEGHWNSVARCAGLKRSGKSCRFRWLNYLRPDLRRGNITLQEQLLILELHSLWGNRWSKIVEHLPGRTDNEIKNYWRTRVQKQAKQLKCDVDSQQFRDTMRYVWIPQLTERIRSESESSAQKHSAAATTTTPRVSDRIDMGLTQAFKRGSDFEIGYGQAGPTLKPEMSGCSLDAQVSPISDLTDCIDFSGGNDFGCFQNGSGYFPESVTSPFDFQQDNAWLGHDDLFENMWNDEHIRFLLQQFNYEV